MFKTQQRLLRFALIIAILTTTILIAQAQTAFPSPANPNANATARAILNYAYGLTNRTDNRVISGQFGSYGDGTTYDSAVQQVQAVYTTSGHYPALTGMDCATPVGMNEVVRYMTDMWNQGYLVTFSCHFRNPWTGRSATDWGNPDTPDQWDRRSVRELTVPGSAAYNNWIATLDDIARHMQTLEDRGVVVLYRPLHELNGAWFWWGGQTGADFTALWRHMFDYFTRVKGLDNLLWVYSPNSGIEVTSQYPGNDVVDMVGLDEYSGLTENPLQINSAGEYDALVATGKPVGLFEFGPIPATGSGWDTTNYNWGNLIRDIKARYPRIFLVQAWEYVWQMGYNRYTGQSTFMNDPWTITRADLPRWSSVPTSTPVTATTLAPTNVPSRTPTRIPSTIAPTNVPPTTPPTTLPPTLPPAGSRVTNGIQALYAFNEGSGSTVRDSSGAGTAINLNISYPPNTRWLTGGGLAITGDTNITSGSAPARLYTAFMQTDAITIEAWVKPANTSQTNGARILAMSNDTSRRNLSLAQWGTQIEGRLRHSTGTDGNGTAFITANNAVSTGLQHLVITHAADGTTRLYVNGVPQSSPVLSGTLDNWNTSLYLNIANELSGGYNWQGELHLIALYNRALSQAEVTQNLSAGVRGLTVGAPTPVPTTVVPTSTPTLIPPTVAPPTQVPPTVAPPTLPPATVVPPTSVPPTTAPVVPQLGAPIQAEGAGVTRSTGWASVNATNANGSAYLINTRSNDTLSTNFAGVGVEIIYVSGSFGTFRVEIDGQIVRTVTTTAVDGEVYFNARLRIEGLTDAVHTLRILPSASAVGIDAFVPLVLTGGTLAMPQSQIAGSGDVQEQFPLEAPPTLAPPINDVPALEATAAPTLDMPTLAPPIAASTLGFDNMAGAANWMTAGGWQVMRDDANPTVGAYWQTVTPDNSEDSLTWLIPFDFTMVQRPVMTFQSWLQAPNSLGWIEASVDGINWQRVTTVSPSESWTTVSVDLSAFIGQPRVNVRLLWQQGSSAEGAVNVWRVDDVTLANLP